MATGIVTAILGLVLLNGFMYLQQPSMIFYPTRELVSEPSDWGLDYTDVKLLTEDGVALHGWYIPRAGAQRALLFFHGNGGNISHRGDSIAIFHRLGFNVLIIDYRGYGQSEGRPSEAGLYQDAAAAWRYLTDERGFAGKDIVIFGRSLGGAVAAQLASRIEAGTLILESTLSSARDFATHAFPILSHVLYLRYGFDNVARLQKVNYPVLVLHSPDDEIMPYRLGEKVYAAAREPKQFVALHGDHNSGFLLSQPEYEQALRSFLARSLPDPEADNGVD
ncbi:MAG: alpha/beta hydrolase [Gammaproteobacteria bacterium]|nr:alpha/beta hydrolase [Gammaproteobacteria bacterium]